jgi:hypothetical protein
MILEDSTDLEAERKLFLFILQQRFRRLLNTTICENLTQSPLDRSTRRIDRSLSTAPFVHRE